MLTKLDIYRPDPWKVEWRISGQISNQGTVPVTPVQAQNTVPLVRQIIYPLSGQAANQVMPQRIALVSSQLLNPASFQVYLRVSSTLLEAIKAAANAN